MSPRSLPVRIHAAAHPSCCAGSVAGVECDLLDRIKKEIEETSAHVCSYCAAALPVSLDEGENLARARAHMMTCLTHPVRGLVELLGQARGHLVALRRRAAQDPPRGYPRVLAEIDRVLATYAELGEFHQMADVEVPEERS